MPIVDSEVNGIPSTVVKGCKRVADNVIISLGPLTVPEQSIHLILFNSKN